MFQKILKINIVIFVLCCASISLLSIGSENSCESLNVQKNWEKSVLCNPPPAPNPPTGEVQVGYVGCTYEFWTTMPDYGPYKVRFDWGDGTPYSPWVNADSTNPLLFRASHTWYHDRSNLIGFYVSAQALDYTTGELSEWSWRSTRIAIHPNHPPNTPEKPSGDTSGNVGDAMTFWTSATDPEDDKVCLWFDWGDGSNSGWTESHGSGETVSESHVWTRQGKHNVRAKAREEGKCSFVSGWSPSLNVKILGTPPNKPKIPTGPTWGTRGKAYIYTTMAIDDDGDHIYYQWDWGDGTTSDWIGPYASGENVSMKHEWTGGESTTCDIRVRAKDDPFGNPSDEQLSDWSDSLSVTKHKRTTTNPLLNLVKEIINFFKYNTINR